MHWNKNKHQSISLSQRSALSNVIHPTPILPSLAHESSWINNIYQVDIYHLSWINNIYHLALQFDSDPPPERHQKYHNIS